MRFLLAARLSPVLLWAGAMTGMFGASASEAVAATPIRVLVWDEQQPEQKQIYENFLGNHLAAHLGGLEGLVVRSVCQNDPEQGLAPDSLDNCDVLIWWGHARHKEIKPDEAKKVVDRIHRGQLSMISLHSAHWSTPFIEAMGRRAQDDALASLPSEDRAGAKLEIIPAPLDAPKYDSARTPEVQYRKPKDGRVTVKLRLPGCSFPAWRANGEPSKLRVLLPAHPIAAGLPSEFTNEIDEMYDEHFHVPEPDEVVLEERWAGGEWFRSGSVWKVGQGKVFYFRPGHETFPVFKDPKMLKIIENAVRFLGSTPAVGNN
jgi:trehalose utilization protein